MRILILGISGQLGHALYRVLSPTHQLCGTYCHNKPEKMPQAQLYHFDVAEPIKLSTVLTLARPELVISSLRGDFPNQLQAHRLLAGYLQKDQGRCVYLSSVNAFDARPEAPHLEAQAPQAISDYGRHKIECEQLLQEKLADRCLIARLPHLYDAARVREELQQLAQGQPVYTNLYLSCNTADNVARALRHCIIRNLSGVVHLTSRDTISQAELTRLLLQLKHSGLSCPTGLLTAEEYREAYGNGQVSPEQLPEHNFYLALNSTRRELPLQFRPSCREVLSQLA